MKAQFNKTKFVAVFALFAMAFLFSIALVAADTLSVSTPTVVTESQNSSFTISIVGADRWNIASPTFPSQVEVQDDEGNVAILSLTTSSNVNNIGGSDQVRVNVTVLSVESGFFLTEESQSITITAQNVSNTAQTITNSVNLKFAKTYCEEGSKGNNVEIIHVQDQQLDNEDEWEWTPRDEVEVEVRVRNDADSDIDVTVVYGLYDFKNDDFVFEDEQDVSIDEDDTEDVILTFTVPATGLDEDDYRFYVKAYDSDDGEEEQCSDTFGSNTFEEVTIKREKNDIEAENIEIPESVSCGQTVALNMDVANTGKDDQKKVRVTVTNTELGLKQEFVINNLDKGESKSVNFDFLVPQTLNEGRYVLKTSLDYDFSNNDDEYDETKTITDQILNLKGNCKLTSNDVQILFDASNAIQSGGKAGEELVIKATIVNTGSRTATFNVEALDFDSWADLSRVEPQTTSIEAATSKEVYFYFDVNEDATGDNTFKINVKSDSQTLKSQTVTVPIQARNGFGGITGNAIINGDNWHLWALGLLNVILVILIIVIAVRVARK